VMKTNGKDCCCDDAPHTCALYDIDKAILKHIPEFWFAIMSYVHDSTFDSVTAQLKLCVEAGDYMSLFAFEPSSYPLIELPPPRWTPISASTPAPTIITTKTPAPASPATSWRWTVSSPWSLIPSPWW